MPALAAYWNLNQQKDVAALLAAFAANDDVRYLDILHLLPPRAREFLNLYTLADATAPNASCYWTALNFDVDQPYPRQTTTRELLIDADPRLSPIGVFQRILRE